MRRVWRGLVSLSVTLFAVLVFASPAFGKDGDGCDVTTDPTCTVVTGSGGSRGGGGGGRVGGGTDVNPCAKYPIAVYGDKPPTVSQACADELQGNYCTAMKADAANALAKPFAQWTAAETTEVNREMAQTGCPPLITTAELAQQALKSIAFPHPSGDRSPSPGQLYRGFPYTYVGLQTFYWTSGDSWKTLTATASADGLTATVTAKPTGLIYDSGDGSSTVACDGPGRPWTSADGNGPPTDGACAYEYTKVTSSPIMSTQSIVWKITWIGTGGTAGEIPQLTTSTSGQLNVMQIQTVVTR